MTAEKLETSEFKSIKLLNFKIMFSVNEIIVGGRTFLSAQ